MHSFWKYSFSISVITELFCFKIFFYLYSGLFYYLIDEMIILQIRSWDSFSKFTTFDNLVTPPKKRCQSAEGLHLLHFPLKMNQKNRITKRVGQTYVQSNFSCSFIFQIRQMKLSQRFYSIFFVRD